MLLPEILIVADCRRLLACIVLPDGLPEIIETIDCANDGQTSAPAIDFSDMGDGCRIVADRIAGILSRYKPATWGLASPEELVKSVVLWLPPDDLAKLSVLRQRPVNDVDISNIAKVFHDDACNYSAEKEHC